MFSRWHQKLCNAALVSFIVWGNSEKAEKELGWRRKVDFKQLVAMMMDSDMKEITGMDCRGYREKAGQGD